MPSKSTSSKVSKSSISKTTSVKKTPTESKNTTAVVQVETVPEPSKTTEANTSNVITHIQTLQGEISNLSTQLSSLRKSLTTLQKEYSKERKQWQKLQNKKKSGGSGVKHQSGIAKPGFISPALCNFIGVSEGTEMARTEVIKFVNKYIKDKQLQDKNNKKIIVPDAKLQTLLQSKKSDEITYFNLQTFMKPHYANPDKKTLSA